MLPSPDNPESVPRIHRIKERTSPMDCPLTFIDTMACAHAQTQINVTKNVIEIFIKQ